jgi:exopolysaccharide biosynthesis polyprenyl glycosylphosphotransferase
LIRLLNAYFPARTLFLGISEACLIALAFVGATIVRLGAGDASVVLSYEQGFLKVLVVSVAFITCMYYFDLYDSSILNNRREVLTRMIQMQGTVCILLAVIYFIYPRLELGRGIFVIGFVLGAIMLFLWRRMFMMLNSLPQFAARILIFGDSALAESLRTEMRARPELGMRVVGQVSGLDNSNGKTELISREEQVGAVLDLVKPYKPDRIIVALGERRGKLPVDALLHLKSHGVTIQAGEDVYEAVTGKISIESLRLSWLLFSPGFRVSRPLVIYKRFASVVLSAASLSVAFPLMALTALAIRMDSAGPAIFRQKRLGQNGKIFMLYKFRTMVEGADLDVNHPPAELTDSRFTRLGRLLRRTHLDELPQLVNILRGDMHFVGPRPFVPSQEQECVEKIPYYQQRWVVKPGATGWAQVNRGYNVTIEDNREKLAYDLFYIKNISIGLDMLIIFKTAKILLLGRGSR